MADNRYRDVGVVHLIGPLADQTATSAIPFFHLGVINDFTCFGKKIELKISVKKSPKSPNFTVQRSAPQATLFGKKLFTFLA